MESGFSWTSREKGLPFRTLELAATASLDTAALGQAMSRARPTGSGWGPDSFVVFGVGNPSGDSRLGYKWHVWWDTPSLWRDDFTLSDGEANVVIVRPDAALTYVSMQRTLYTSERLGPDDKRQRISPPAGMQLATLDERLKEFPLIRSRLPPSDWELTSVGQELYLGRPARRVRATRRADSVRNWDPRLSGFWEGVDEYACVIDDALQIVLSVTGIVDSAVVATISVEHVSVDAPLPANTFDFSPPLGTRIAQVSGTKKTTE